MVLRYVERFRFDCGSGVGITAVAFSASGKYLAAAGLDGKVRIWNIETGHLLYLFSSTVSMLSLTWVGDQDNVVLCGLKDGTICCLTASQGDLQVSGFWAHGYPVEHLAMRDGLLASGAHEEVRIWKPDNEAWLMETVLPNPPKTSYNRVLQIVVTSLHWMGEPGSKAQLLVTYLNHGVHIFEGSTGEHIRTVPIPGQIGDASLSSDGQLIAISNVITGFDVYSLESGAAICSVGHTVGEYRKVPVLFIHNSVALLGGNLHGNVHLWDVESGRKLHCLIHPKGDKILALDAHYNPTSDTFLIVTGILESSADFESAVVVWKAEELGRQEELDEDPKGWLTHTTGTFYAIIAIPVLAAGFFYFV